MANDRSLHKYDENEEDELNSVLAHPPESVHYTGSGNSLRSSKSGFTGPDQGGFMIRHTILLLLLSFPSLGAWASQEYALECRGGGDMLTFYRHTHNAHVIILKFKWSQNESAEPQPGECRYLNPVSGRPRPVTLFYQGRQKDGYGVEFTLSRDMNAIRAMGPETGQMTRRLLHGSQTQNLSRYCVAYDDYSGLYEIGNIRYAKGFIVKGMASRGGCD